ncbi:hypothetical protein YTPLAS18_07420 [Nitrospira sp.]|nr:hypothetical protein YTPLAS18_07420 [Nitrospira sp.]
MEQKLSCAKEFAVRISLAATCGLVLAFFAMSIGFADDSPPTDIINPIAENTAPSQSSDQPQAEDVQERGVVPNIVRPGLTPQVLTPLQSAPLSISALPGNVAIQTFSGKYLTAVGGGGRITDVFHTDAAAIGAWETYRLFLVLGGGVPPKFAIQTASSNYITAVGGGGRSSDVLHTDAKQVQAWETFSFGLDQYGWRHAIQTVNGHYLTAVGAGGKTTDAIHTDAVKADNWESFYIWKCGDLGSGRQYTLSSTSDPYGFVFAYGGGGRVNTRDGNFIFGAIGVLSDYQKRPASFDNSWQRFLFMRQNDGSYALRTSNGVNYLTAIQGGGLPAGGITTDNLVTDRTQVQAWEKFRFIEHGSCTYVIQTSSGHYLGKKTATTGIGKYATNISDLNQATKFRLGVLF